MRDRARDWTLARPSLSITVDEKRKGCVQSIVAITRSPACFVASLITLLVIETLLTADTSPDLKRLLSNQCSEKSLKAVKSIKIFLHQLPICLRKKARKQARLFHPVWRSAIKIGDNTIVECPQSTLSGQWLKAERKHAQTADWPCQLHSPRGDQSLLSPHYSRAETGSKETQPVEVMDFSLRFVLFSFDRSEAEQFNAQN